MKLVKHTPLLISLCTGALLQGCVTLEDLRTGTYGKNNAPVTESNPPSAGTQNDVQVKEVTRVVYLEKPQAGNTHYCQTKCTKEEITAQLNSYLNKPAVTNMFDWFTNASTLNADAIKKELDEIASTTTENDNLNLMYGLFYSVPKTGFRNTNSALEFLLKYPISSLEGKSDSTFLSFLINNLTERKQLIEERSALRNKNSLLEKENTEQKEVTNRLNSQLRQLKEIERSMIRGRTQNKQYKVAQ